MDNKVKSGKLKGYLQKYPFLQNQYFCEAIKVKPSTLKAWLKYPEREITESEVNRLLPLFESFDQLFTGWSALHCS